VSLKEYMQKVDPDLIVQEAMYGFVMALTFITSAQFGLIEASTPHHLIVAILAMNFVWGSIDMYIFYRMDVNAQRRQLRLLRENSAAVDREANRNQMYDELGGTIFDSADEQSKEKATAVLLDAKPEDTKGIRRDRHWMMVNAVASFIVTVATAVPIVICLTFIQNMHSALMWSSVSASFCLFFVGYALSPYSTRFSRVLTGLFTTLMALVLTIFAAFFGG